MIRFFSAAALVAAALATPAAAQVAGNYAGTAADGSGISFTVGTDGNGATAITSVGVGFNALCKGGSPLNSGWGYGIDAVIKGAKAKNVTGDTYFTIGLTWVFDGESATGTVNVISPTLAPVGPKPKKALYCKSATQGFSATLQSGNAHTFPSGHGPVLLSRNW